VGHRRGSLVSPLEARVRLRVLRKRMRLATVRRASWAREHVVAEGQRNVFV